MLSKPLQSLPTFSIAIRAVLNLFIQSHRRRHRLLSSFQSMHPRPINSRILFSFSLRNDTNEIKLAWLTCLLNNGTNGKGVRLAQRFSQEQGCERCRNLHSTHGLRSDFSSRSVRHVADHATIHESTSEYGGRSLEDSLVGASARNPNPYHSPTTLLEQ